MTAPKTIRPLLPEKEQQRPQPTRLLRSCEIGVSMPAILISSYREVCPDRLAILEIASLRTITTKLPPSTQPHNSLCS
jgi:hypothetical protein